MFQGTYVSPAEDGQHKECGTCDSRLTDDREVLPVCVSLIIQVTQKADNAENYRVSIWAMTFALLH